MEKKKHKSSKKIASSATEPAHQKSVNHNPALLQPQHAYSFLNAQSYMEEMSHQNRLPSKSYELHTQNHSLAQKHSDSTVIGTGTSSTKSKHKKSAKKVAQ